MSKANFETLLEAGVHFGHLKRKWNPAMAPYIFEEKKGIHIIDLNKTIAHLDQACAALKQIAKSGKKILFVATKKQAKDLLAERVKEINMPFVTERWTGGMLTNFQTTRKSIRKMTAIDKMKTDGTWETLNKRERLFKTRQREKLEKNFGSIAEMTRQPAAIFIVDILKEHIALKEARRLSIPVFAMVDTNSNPGMVDFPIPANDDASKAIQVILDDICGAVKEGLSERKATKEANKDEAVAKEKAAAKKEAKAEEPKATEVKAEEPKAEVETPVEEVPKKAAPKTKAKAKKVAAPKVEEVKEEVTVEVTEPAAEATDDAKEAK